MGNYFSHDSNARSDSKIIALRMKHQWAGYGLYWALIEKLRDSTCYKLETDFSSLAYDLRADASILKSVICDFGLFAFTEEGDYFYSESLLRRMEAKDAKSEKARESVNKRWNKVRSQCDGSTNVSESDTNVILLKEKKRKEIKEKTSTIVDAKEPPDGDACAEAPASTEKPLKTWKEDFNIYRQELDAAYASLIADSAFITERQKFHPELDINLSLEKAYRDYWATEAGWQHKKKSKAKVTNWKSTFSNALTLGSNKVRRFPGKAEYTPTTEVQQKFTEYLKANAPLMLNIPVQPTDEEIAELRKIKPSVMLSIIGDINNNRYLINGRNSVYQTIMEIRNKHEEY